MPGLCSAGDQTMGLWPGKHLYQLSYIPSLAFSTLPHQVTIHDTDSCPDGEPVGPVGSHFLSYLWRAGKRKVGGSGRVLCATGPSVDRPQIYLGMEDVAQMPSPRNYPI